MELISELIAIDDEAKRLVAEAREKADSLKAQAADQIKGIKESNSEKIKELKADSAKQISDSVQEANASGEGFENEKKAQLDEYFSTHGSEMVDSIVNGIYGAAE